MFFRLVTSKTKSANETCDPVNRKMQLLCLAPSTSSSVALTNRAFGAIPRRSTASIGIGFYKGRPSRVVGARGVSPPVSVSYPLEGWTLLTGLAVCGAGAQLIERHTRIGVYLSAPLLAILLSLSAASLGLMPHSACTIYDVVWMYLMPMAVALYLLESDISLLLKTAGQSIVAFFNGAVGTVAGTFVAYMLLGKCLGPEGSNLAAALCASYIGGSINFAAVSQVLGLNKQGSMLAAAMTADNLAMAMYITVLMSIPATFDTRDTIERDAEETELPGGEVCEICVRPETVSVSLAAAVLACALGESVATNWPALQGGGLACTAFTASGLGILGARVSRMFLKTTHKQMNQETSPFGGAGALGTSLMMVFFATIGAVAGNFTSLLKSGWLLGFIGVQLTVQLVVSLLLGSAMKIPMPVILVAANANVGGSATAAAMASAKGWGSLLQAAILTGVLGYTIATPVGCVMANALAFCPTLV